MRNGNLDSKARSHGSVVKKRGVKHLYVLFYYLGKRVEVPMYLNDTAKNRAFLERWLDHHMGMIDDGTFLFAEALPGARAALIDRFTRLEYERGVRKTTPFAVIQPRWEDLSFGEVAQQYLAKRVPLIDSVPLREDVAGAVNSRLIPYWGDEPLGSITNGVVVEFIAYLNGRSNHGAAGKNCKGRVGALRIKMILRTLKRVISFAEKTYGMRPAHDLFEDLKDYLPKRTLKKDARGRAILSSVWRYDEMVKILEHMQENYVRVTLFSFLTGMGPSEVAGLRNIDVDVNENKLHVCNFISRKEEKADGKREARTRSYPLSAALLACIKPEDLAAEEVRYLFRAPKGGPIRKNNFQEVWKKALKKAGLRYRGMRSMRHTFACWLLLLGMDAGRVACLMGHKSKEMVFEVYGPWREGVHKDKGPIRAFFGEDFLA